MKNIFKILTLTLLIVLSSCSTWNKNIQNQTWTLLNSWKIEDQTWTIEINWNENNTWKLAVESENIKDFEKTTKLKITKNAKWETCVFDECIHKDVKLTEKDWVLRWNQLGAYQRRSSFRIHYRLKKEFVKEKIYFSH